jgi:hypothetical protein
VETVIRWSHGRVSFILVLAVFKMLQLVVIIVSGCVNSCSNKSRELIIFYNKCLTEYRSSLLSLDTSTIAVLTSNFPVIFHMEFVGTL